jgi:hypothetical protein
MRFVFIIGVGVVLGGAIGWVFGLAGYGVDTWQYWAIAVPSSFLVGIGSFHIAVSPDP